MLIKRGDGKIASIIEDEELLDDAETSETLKKALKVAEDSEEANEKNGNKTESSSNN